MSAPCWPSCGDIVFLVFRSVLCKNGVQWNQGMIPVCPVGLFLFRRKTMRVYEGKAKVKDRLSHR
jgi:hypothetical protein